MDIQINTDRTVSGADSKAAVVEAELRSGLDRFASQLTRLEVHLGDRNRDKGGPDDRYCSIEARPAGQKPVGVTHHAATTEEAVAGAIRKLQSLLTTQFGRQSDVKGAPSIRDAGLGR